MWQIFLLAVFVSLGGYYSLSDQQQVNMAQEHQADHLAENMSTYRAAMIDYLTQNPGLRSTSVASAALRAGGGLSWLPSEALQQWENYIDANGMIYIYPSSPLPRNITFEILALSRNSILVGQIKADLTTLYSPMYGDTLIPLPALVLAMPAGSPVWLASAN